MDKVFLPTKLKKFHSPYYIKVTYVPILLNRFFFEELIFYKERERDFEREKVRERGERNSGGKVRKREGKHEREKLRERERE
jgi:hypothetical protein